MEKKLSELRSAIIEAVPSIKEPIHLYICSTADYNNFESRYGEPVMALEPEQSDLPLLPDIRFVVKRFSSRPIRLDDVIRAFQMLAPSFLIFNEGANPDIRANKYREIIDTWDFYNNTLDQQSAETIEFLHRLLTK